MKFHQPTHDILRLIDASILKRYGQNFLVDSTIIEQIMQALELQPHHHVLEVGPGLGALTQPLLQQAKHYTAYEIDHKFSQYLQTTYPNAVIRAENFLKANTEPFDRLVSNLPYYITSDMLEKIFKDFSSVEQVVVMMQKEVAEKLFLSPQHKDYGPLTIFMQVWYTLTPIVEVYPESFYPQPHVISSVIQCRRHHTYDLDTKAFFYFIKKMFLNRRKNVLNNLDKLSHNKDDARDMLSLANIDASARPEAIDIPSWVQLFYHYQTYLKKGK